MKSERHTPSEVLHLYPVHDHTLCGLLASRAHVIPPQPFLIFQGRTTTYGDSVVHVAMLGSSLASRGIKKGDRVAIMANNSDRYVLLLFALARVGAIAVPINPELNTAEAAYILLHAEVRPFISRLRCYQRLAIQRATKQRI